ncbi:MAG: ABC transporter permease [Clostridia bacterium]|nr:ABC transporter permease [Clostridia bacterium]
MSDNNGFKTVIDSKHKLFDLHIKETLGYKDLIMLTVKKDFTAKYKQTVLGPAWAVIQPLLTTFVFTFIFGSLAKLPIADADGSFVVPGFLFYMSGNICWSYFSTTLQHVSNTFIANRATMGKVYYPRLVSPVATALSNLISFGIQFALFFVIWLFYIIKGGTSLAITPMILMVPLTIIQMMLLAIGCGIVISSLTTKYRDLAMLVSFGLNLWHYGTPIAYGLKLVPEKYLWFYMFNPMTPVITTFRNGMFGFGYFNSGYYLISWAITLAIFFVGLILFSRIERNFMDTV